MSYQVIARKWRPQTFAEVTGQESITRTLQNAIEHDRLHHAYLFSGARGVGKTTTARLLAKALNCHKFDKPTVTPCSFNDPSACASCREIAEGNSLDTIEFDAASNTGVDKIRDLVLENIDIAPARDRYKIFIIDEVHMLSTSSFNALLKTLEEPPPRVVFVMATTELHKLPDTILSRCQQFEFRIIALNKISERLKIIADAEKISVSADALREIARAGEGSMRDAQSAFDQVISFSGAQIEIADVTNALGIAGNDLLNRVIAAISEQQPLAALQVVDELVSRGQDLRNFCRDLLTNIRDLLIAKIAGDDDRLLETASQSRESLNEQAAAFSESDLTRFFQSLSETETKIREALQPRYVLEIGLVKLVEMRSVAGIEKVLERLAKLEQALQNGSDFPNNSSGGNQPVAPKNPNSPPPNASASVEQAGSVEFFRPPVRQTSAPETSAPTQTIAEVLPPKPAPVLLKEGADVRAALQNSFEARNLMWLAISLEKASVVKVSGSALRLQFASNNKQYQATWETADNLKILSEICLELFGRKLEIIAELTGQAQTRQLSATESIEQTAKDELWKIAEADPTVQQIIKTFRARIVKVWRDDEPAENAVTDKQ